jgi:glycogen operon protein
MAITTEDWSGLRLRRGHPLPLGATVRREGLNFAVFSAHATWMNLALFRPGDHEPWLEVPLDPRLNRTGDVWHVLVDGLPVDVEYGYRAGRESDRDPRLHRFDPRVVLLDPYARAVSGAAAWGERGPGPGLVRPRRGRIVDEEFDWGDEAPLNRHLADTVIYELGVRGFTAHPSSGVAHPGTFAGLAEKIPYLRELGVTAVELLPLTEFEENDVRHRDPVTGQPLRNHWGYQPLALFAPKAALAASGRQGGEVREFREMVKAFHAAGIEVILDMVFNHTGEGPESGPVVSWRGLDNATYYLLDPRTGRYRDYSGCGNTLNCNHPVVRNLIMASLRHWVTEMHVDGFRFDLASILGRGRDGTPLASPPLIEAIAGDPVLAHTKLIAEAWDASGLYQVGSFPAFGRWAEWNGRFRDDVRRFLRGDPGFTGALATRLSGSADLYQDTGRGPHHSVNFVTCHDGFTLADLLTYEKKRNERNGEHNRDGSDHEAGWNCGVEGPTDVAEVGELRLRQARNFAAVLLLSQGVPMVLAGDEMGRTQGGNNNGYCQDNEVGWVDWSRRESGAGLFRFFRLMIERRLAHPALRRRTFVPEAARRPWVRWQGARRGVPDWSEDGRLLGMHLVGGAGEPDLFLVVSARATAARVELPHLHGKRWRRAVDTSLPSPADVVSPGQEPVHAEHHYDVPPHTVVLLVAG